MELLSKENGIFFDWSCGDGSFFLAEDQCGRFMVGFEAQKDYAKVVAKYLIVVICQNDKLNKGLASKALTSLLVFDLLLEWGEPQRELPTANALQSNDDDTQVIWPYVSQSLF